MSSQAQPHRAWSDEQVPANYSARGYAPRSSSFSASRAPPPPNWGNHLPPPPVPPLPPSLIPGFQSPSLAHSRNDFFFAEPPKRPPEVSPPWSNASVTVPSSPVTGPAPGWTSYDPRVPSDPRFSSAEGAPVVPPRPPTADGHPQNKRTRPAKRPTSSHGASHGFPSHALPASPPPVMPPRPTTAYGDMNFSSPIATQPPSLPAVPPKTFTSPPAASPPLPLPHSAPIPSPPAKNWPLSDPVQSPPAWNWPPPEHSHSYPNVRKPDSSNSHSRTESSDLKRALSLSLNESQPKQNIKSRAQEEEDEELARALAESLALSTQHRAEPSHSPVTPSARVSGRWSAGPSSPRASGSGHMAFPIPILENVPHDRQPDVESDLWSKRRPSDPDPGGRAALSPTEVADHVAEAKRVQEEEDREATRRLMEEEAKLMEEEAKKREAEKRERERRDEEMARRADAEESTRRAVRQAQERKDAEMARRLAEENDKPAPAHVTAAPPQPQHPPPAPDTAIAAGTPGLPQYDDVVTPRLPQPQSNHPNPGPAHSAPLPPGAARQSIPGRTTSAVAVAKSAERVDFARASNVAGGAVAQASGQGAGRRQSNGQGGSRRPSTAGSSATGHSETHSLPPNGAPAPSRPNHSPVSRESSLDPELLKGVSYGFQPPDTQLAPAQLAELPLCAPFPEVISLHRAPSAPFHVMAPSWRHLMRLLAQLETRIEATIDTIARTKEESQLRVVVQFAKLPYTANTWRTILYLSLDHPVPHRHAWRYTNGDTNVLPYSYVLNGEIPSHLTASHLSQLYVIPLSQTSPFPILPIALPNLALYLQSAMRDSRARKVQNDPSSGMRRLAKIVGACYPEEVVAQDEEREPTRGVGGLFKRVVGLGGRRRDTQGNEDVYDIITPFRVDQYTVTS